MKCPFCAETINDEAIFCRFCRHDLSVPKPLLDQVKDLSQKIESLQKELAEVRLGPALRSAAGPKTVRDRIAALVVYFGGYVLLPAAVIVLTHYMTLYQLHFSRVYVQVICAAIALPFGYDMFWRVRQGIGGALLAGVLAGILSAAGASVVVLLIDQVPILPNDSKAWELTIDFIISVALTFVAGNAIASVLNRAVPGARLSEDSLAVTISAILLASSTTRDATANDRLNSVEKALKAATALATAMGGLYAAIRSGQVS